MKISRASVAAAVLAVLLVVALAYIVMDKTQQQYMTQMQASFQTGYTQGLQYGITSLLMQTDSCQTTWVRAGNFTRQLVDVSCLQAAG